MEELKVNMESSIEYISVFGIIGGIALGIQLDYKFFMLSIVSLMLLLFIGRRKRRKIRKYYEKTLRNQWGRDHNIDRDFSIISKLYEYMGSRNNENGTYRFAIDDITWRDLNMDSVFSKVDHTKSLAGANYLYYILRNPLFDEGELRNRNDIVDALLNNRDISQVLQIPLMILGRDSGKELFIYFKDGVDTDTKYLTIYRILSILSYISIGLLFWDRHIGFVALISVIMVNAIIYQTNKNRIYEEIEIFKAIGDLIGTGKSILGIDTEGIDLEQAKIKDILDRTKGIYRNISILNTNDGGNTEIQVLMDYINMVTLRETIAFYKTIDLINEHREDIFKLYRYLGKIDAYISIASYRDGISFYTEPELIDEEEGFYMKADKLYHPLLEKPVPYSFKLDNKGALVTGSNASGKSTYLRTIGINALFSQTLYMALAKNYNANYFRLLTSIGTTDSIEEGDSYFMAEAKSLKRIIDILDGVPVLCILDEIFRGTNTAERISAASQVLDYMIDGNCCIIAATHDLELTTMVDDRFINCHFRETIRDEDIKFDYILRDGP
ncbi:MAG: DNA mismatch repair protein MutS, partial [Tissierellia bacterium]|nr:DNA mismatch repair protein MutS [Tissierellia bacterium]